MKPIEDQKRDKANALAKLLTEQAILMAKYLSGDLSHKERLECGFKIILIAEVEIPLILSQPLQRIQYPSGGISIIQEKGTEFIIKPR